MKRLLLSAAAAVLLAAPAFADGGPVPEPMPPAPPPEPAPEPVMEPEPAPPPPPAESRWYIEGYGGVTFVDELNWTGFGSPPTDYSMDTGYNFGGAIGAHLSPWWDLEVDVFYATMGYECCDTDVSGLSVMLDLIYNFNTGWAVDPYLGAGMGVTRVHYDGIGWNGVEGSEWRFGFQFMGGLMFEISESIGLFAEYRYHDVDGDADVAPQVSEVEWRSHNASAGLRFNF
jgi:opacity protein-like surface antigen